MNSRRRSGRRRLTAELLGAVMALAASGDFTYGERPWVYALTHVKIVTAPGQVIEKGTLVIRGGLIEAVGESVEAPPDAEVIEGEESWTVYPAFIDSAAKVGIKVEERESQSGPPNFAAIAARLSRPRPKPKGAPHELSAIHPEKAVVDELDAGDHKIKRHRKLGFALAQVIPLKGVFRGYTTLFALREGVARQLIVKDRYAQVVSLETSGFFGPEYPTSKIGAIAAVRQALLDARRKAVWKQRYERNPRGLKRPEFESSDRALMAALEGRVPVLFVANATFDHGRFAKLGREFGLRGMTLALGCQERLSRLQAGGMPVLLPLQFPKKPKVDSEDAIEAVSLEQMQTYLRAPGLPALLADAGVEFAFATVGMTTVSDFSKNLKKVVEAGLSEEKALAALTTTPARLLGLSQVVGTLEPGKIANLLVVDGDLFSDKPKFRYLFVDGRGEEFEAKEKKGHPEAVVDPRGDWEITTEVMGRSLQSTWTIEGTAGAYSGYSESERGRRDFESVELEGDAMTIQVGSPMGTMEITVVISGETLAGDTTIDSPRGSISIKVTGKRVSGPEGD
ncbi:MAG: amidohydrolase family protein [Acidobacteriota bacterium]